MKQRPRKSIENIIERLVQGWFLACMPYRSSGKNRHIFYLRYETDIIFDCQEYPITNKNGTNFAQALYFSNEQKVMKDPEHIIKTYSMKPFVVHVINEEIVQNA